MTDEEKTELGVVDATNNRETESGVNNTPQKEEIESTNVPTTNHNKITSEQDVSEYKMKANSFMSIDAEKQGQRVVGGTLDREKFLARDSSVAWPRY
jgi:hypothetical protein